MHAGQVYQLGWCRFFAELDAIDVGTHVSIAQVSTHPQVLEKGCLLVLLDQDVRRGGRVEEMILEGENHVDVVLVGGLDVGPE